MDYIGMWKGVAVCGVWRTIPAFAHIEKKARRWAWLESTEKVSDAFLCER